MNAHYLLPSLLTLHVSGLIMMAGTTLVDFITFRTFLTLMDQGQEKSSGWIQAMSKYGRFIGIGGALLILTGIGMMAVTRGVFGDQLWFRIKIGLVVLVILNGMLIGRRLGVKLKKSLTDSSADSSKVIGNLRGKLNRFYQSQLAIFFIIIILSVFKFN